MAHFDQSALSGIRWGGIARGAALVGAGAVLALALIAPRIAPTVPEGFAPERPAVIQDWHGNAAGDRSAR